jgi:hypothetical protein
MYRIKNIIVLLLFCSLCFSEAFAQKTLKICDLELAKTAVPEYKAQQLLTAVIAKEHQNRLMRMSEKDRKKANPNPHTLLSSSMDLEQKYAVAQNHALIDAVYRAYADHRPLVLSPDIIWLTIAQGSSIHIQENAEALRNKFVEHKGKKFLEVTRPYYAPTSKAYWEDIFPEFSEKIQENTHGPIYDIMTPKFSTTGIVEKAAFEISLMDAMSPYFEYGLTITCGIPNVTIEGTPEDWKMIEDRLDSLKQYNLEWWVDEIKPLIKEMRLIAEGKGNPKFWENIFAVQTIPAGCGTETSYQGWIFKLFPYLVSGNSYSKNPLLKDEEQWLSEISKIPTGISKAELKLDNNGDKSLLYFYAGFTAIEQNPKTMALKPHIDWFVVDTGESWE